MSKKNQHVVPSGKDWAVKGEGNSRKAIIYFQLIGQKQLLLKFAKLKILQ